MNAALGFSGGAVHVAGVTRSEASTRCDLVVQSVSGPRLRLAIEADVRACVLKSSLTASDEYWPPLFHRLAHFGIGGPVVQIRLDPGLTEPAPGQPHAWHHLDMIASDEEKASLEELIGLAMLSVELAMGDIASEIDQILLSSLQSRGIVLHRQAAYGQPSGDGSQGEALTALRTSVEEYYTSGGWEHVRLQLDGSVVAGVSCDSLTFKVFRTPESVGLEFRPLLETGEHPFQTFPGSETDEFGQVYRITLVLLTGDLAFPEMETIKPGDRALIDAIAAALYPTMRTAGIAVGHLDERTYASWVASGATFSAAFKAATKS